MANIDNKQMLNKLISDYQPNPRKNNEDDANNSFGETLTA